MNKGRKPERWLNNDHFESDYEKLVEDDSLLENIKYVTELPIYSIKLEPEDYNKKLEDDEICSSYFNKKIGFRELGLEEQHEQEHEQEHEHRNQQQIQQVGEDTEAIRELKKRISLKYTELIMDISLIEYEYFKTHTEMNQTIKEYFSCDSEELNEDLQEEGFNMVNLKLEFFKKLEVLLIKFNFLKKEFEKRYGKLYNKEDILVSRRQMSAGIMGGKDTKIELEGK